MKETTNETVNEVQTKKNVFTTRFIIEAGIIAALYAVVTLALAPISFSLYQVRISEALNILPYFTPAAIPGLFIGCLISNTLSPTSFGMIDIVLGSSATLVSAILAYLVRKNKWLVPIPAIVINAIVVGIILNIMIQIPLGMAMITVGVGQVIACYGLGMPLIFLLNKYKKHVFKNY